MATIISAAEALELTQEARGQQVQAEIGELVGLEGKIQEDTEQRLTKIAEAISKAVSDGRDSAHIRHDVRIARSRTSPEDVMAIEYFADVASRAAEDALVAQGYAIRAQNREERDPRDNVGAQPEYYTTSYFIHWA